ncbi:hypothetical protein [Micromonospora fulviviridis]|uniref:Uncharacterized protein n=1 Tax=Micromonospora fulviviridis TaxID=47860 RepID=A0ABV2VEA9_9ACTN
MGPARLGADAPLVVRLGCRHPGAATGRLLGGGRGDARRGGDAGGRGVEPSTHRGDRFLGPLDLVERLVAALGGGHDLAAQLPAELLEFRAELVGAGRAAAALRAQGDGEADQHHGQDRQHGAEPERAVAVGDEQDERRQGRERHANPEQDGQQRGTAVFGGGDRGGHG